MTVHDETDVPAGLVKRVIQICGSHFATVTGISSAQWDTEHLYRNVTLALRAVPPAERGTYARTLENYIHANRARLAWMWTIYGPGGFFPGVYQLVQRPECYVLCERIERDSLRLSQIWADEVGEDTPLVLLREAWLRSPDDTGKR